MIFPRFAKRSFVFVYLAIVVASVGAVVPIADDDSVRPLRTRIAAHEATQRIIVKYVNRDVALAAGPVRPVNAETLSDAVGVELRHHREMGLGAVVLTMSRAVPLFEASAIAKRISMQPGIEYAEPDARMYLDAVPNDPQFSSQWHFNDPFGGVNAPAAWDITTGNAATVVAVVDTGYTAHPDLTSRLLAGYDFVSDAIAANDGDGRDVNASDPGTWVTQTEIDTIAQFKDCKAENSSWHGTAVAGVIGAATNNGSDVSGIDWNARILPIRALGKCGSGSLSDIVDGILWAAGIAIPGVPANTTPAKIINLSLGSEGSCSTSYQSAIGQAINAGKIVVASAGNANTSADHRPSNCPGVISVAATSRTGAKASYSSFGSTVTIAAPGGDSGDLIRTLGNTGTTVPGSPTVVGEAGTSFSAPMVSGIASLMVGLRPELDAATVKKILTASVRPFPDATCSTATCGAGIVDAAAAVRATRDGGIAVATFVGFQDADVGRPNPDLALKVTNLATTAIGVNPLFVTNNNEFSVVNSTCVGTIAPDATCTLSLRFNPAVTGSRTGDLQFSTTDGRNYRLSLAAYAYAAAKVTEQTAGTSSAPQYIAKGPDGNYWYTQATGNRVARMTPQGEVTEYTLPTTNSNPFDIVAGADGNIWFTELGIASTEGNRIGRITPAGVITEFSVPTAASQPRGIALGSDGNVWFTEITGAKIGRITPQGVITEFTIPWASAAPRGITGGPDGNLWFTDSGGLSIGKLTPAGVFTRYTLPWTSNNLRGITTGPDGNIWFVESTGNRVGRITPAGVMTEFPLPRVGELPLGIVAGPDGGVWYTANAAGRVGRVDTATGQISEYRLPSAGSSPIGIVVGPNKQMWIANSGPNKIASLSIPGVSGAAVYSDLWWGGSTENGWGMTVQQHGNTQFNVFFVYDGTGKAIWYAMPGGTWNADYTVYSGGLAKPTSSPLNNYNPAQFMPGGQVGTMNITFTSASTATLNYVINGISGQKTISRQPLGGVDNTPGLLVGDMWWAGSAQDGWGVSITQQYRTVFAAWYTYDSAGNTTWYTLPGGTWNGNVYSGTLATATSSPWLGQAYNPNQFTPAAVGTISFNFTDANNATMTYNFTAGPFAGTSQTKTLVRQPY